MASQIAHHQALILDDELTGMRFLESIGQLPEPLAAAKLHVKLPR